MKHIVQASSKRLVKSAKYDADNNPIKTPEILDFEKFTGLTLDLEEEGGYGLIIWEQQFKDKNRLKQFQFLGKLGTWAEKKGYKSLSRDFGFKLGKAECLISTTESRLSIQVALSSR